MRGSRSRRARAADLLVASLAILVSGYMGVWVVAGVRGEELVLDRGRNATAAGATGRVAEAHPGSTYGVDPSSDAFLAAGAAKSALSFDGRNDYALIEDFKHLPNARITVAAWIKVYRHKSFSRVLSHKWINWGWNLYADGAGVVRFGIGQNNTDFAAGRIIFRDKWHFVVGRYDGEHIQVFVDGKPGAKTHLPGAAIDDRGYVSIGGAEYDPFVGEIDDVRVYNASLSDAAILRSMLSPPLGTERDLVGYWKMDEAGGDVLRDLSGYGNHAHLGKGKRMPRWIQSEAPVSVPCVISGESVTLSFAGTSSDGTTPRAYLTAITDPAAGDLLQVAADQPAGDGPSPIRTLPVEVHHGGGSVAFRSAPGLEAPRCAEFHYRVHNGRASSPVGRLAVDVLPAGSGVTCDAASHPDWVERHSRCWLERTAMDHVRPHVSRPLISIVIPLYNQAELLQVRRITTARNVSASNVSGESLGARE